jgi:cob(I)alamin adenosyltransferase
MKDDIALHRRRRGSDGTLPPTAGTVYGQIVIFTGKGKGKSSAAFGMAQRAIVQKMQVGVVQFFGGSVESAEYRSLAANPLCDFTICGNECHWQIETFQHDMENVTSAWDKAKYMMKAPTYDMVILDDITLMIKHRYLKLDELMAALRQRRSNVHVVITGRYAPFELTDIADIVTEMREVKHPGSKLALLPQTGIEF